jgi:hypothetical protein
MMLRPYVERWHREALDAIWTKDFTTTWDDFLNARNRIRVPAGARLRDVGQLANEDTFTLGSGNSSVDHVARVFRAAATVHRRFPRREK